MSSILLYNTSRLVPQTKDKGCLTLIHLGIEATLVEFRHAWDLWCLGHLLVFLESPHTETSGCSSTSNSKADNYRRRLVYIYVYVNINVIPLDRIVVVAIYHFGGMRIKKRIMVSVSQASPTYKLTPNKPQSSSNLKHYKLTRSTLVHSRHPPSSCGSKSGSMIGYPMIITLNAILHHVLHICSMPPIISFFTPLDIPNIIVVQ